MQLTQELPDYRYALRSADGSRARINDRVVTSSFIISPDELIEDWPPVQAQALAAADMAPVLALLPEVILLGTGSRQVFPPAAVMAACLTAGIGIEVMDNPAAARTFNVLASEGRRVAAGFLLSPA